MLRRKSLGFLRLTTVALAVGAVHAAGPAIDQQFTKTVRPFITKYCVGCHSGSSPAAQFDLKSYTSVEMVVRDHPRWALLAERLTAKEMPPAPMPQPPDDVRLQVIEWVKDVRASEARKTAGDPGVVLARRLSNAEYDYSIRDLTGVDIRPTREFPVDPANPAGFDNSGESLTMSPALLNKYLMAAREVADHMVLKPDGFDFVAYPMLVETDRDKYATHRIIDFYKAQPTDYADYFEAAWRYKHRAALGSPNSTLESTAHDAKVSAKYLATVWQLLEEPADKAKQEVGPVAKLLAMWRALPAPNADQLDPKSLPVRDQCAEMRDFVVKIRNHTAMQFAAPVVRGLPPGSQILLGWKNREFAAHRREFDPKALINDTDDPPLPPARIPGYAGLHQEGAPRWTALMATARSGDQDLVVPAAERKRYEESFARFASIFPDHFYVSERGRFFPDDSTDKGRLLSAGNHSVMGFFRDDQPLMELILDENRQKELDRLWTEFDFIADHTARTFVQYFFNQSGEVRDRDPESGTPRPPNNAVTDSPVIIQLRDEYLAKAVANPANDPVAPLAIRTHFDEINATLRGLEKMHAAAEPLHLQSLLALAARAYRRPLSKAESDDILAYYRSLREKSGLNHEDAIRDSIVSILMSPDFCYRIDMLDAGSNSRTVTAKSGTVPAGPLPAYSLASRLSYFLWASLPDKELLAHAASGDLAQPKVLLAQTRRMLKDPRVVGLATEFGGNWLDFRRFETHNSVDRDRFPAFNNDLREAMFQEPIHLLADVIRNNRSVLDLIYGNDTFVNPSLASHYGMPAVSGGETNWVHVENAGQYGRGSLLPMAVFLTQNSPGLRTSPVKRGYWVVRRVLGEVIPPPPPVVPELPHDESKSDLPIRDMLAQHRENPLCGGCHKKFDVFGLAFEGYGPVGESRTKDLANRLVDTLAAFPGGSEGKGVEGVRAYIHEHRENDYLDNISRKLLAFALGRSLQLSDELTVDKMRSNLAAGGNRFDSLVETIVTSPQFLNKRELAPPRERTASTKER